MAQYFDVHPDNPQVRLLRQAAQMLHAGGVVAVPEEWDADVRDCWRRLSVVDVAARSPSKANAMTTGLGWYDTNAAFVRSRMVP